MSCRPFPITLRNCCKNSPGTSWLIHSCQVAEQRQAPFLNNRGERWLFSYSPHFTIGHTLIPGYINDLCKTPLTLQHIRNFSANLLYKCIVKLYWTDCVLYTIYRSSLVRGGSSLVQWLTMMSLHRWDLLTGHNAYKPTITTSSKSSSYKIIIIIIMK